MRRFDCRKIFSVDNALFPVDNVLTLSPRVASFRVGLPFATVPTLLWGWQPIPPGPVSLICKQILPVLTPGWDQRPMREDFELC
jgi:hypothetical protein